jgi:outer membrane protein assembly factor BamE (lipoprotein component of BamABCDE complex)
MTKKTHLYHTFQPMHLTIVALSALCLMTASCAPKVNEEGHIALEKASDKIKAGSSYKQDVVKLFGTPSTKSSFGDETWYYVSAHKEAYAFFKPETTNQNVLRVAFDKNDMVTDVKEYSLKDAQDVSIASRITPTEGQKLGLWEQMIGNLGKFNKNTEAR